MLAGNYALRLPDVHDVGYDDPADPCPGCLHMTLDNGICAICDAEFCERCGKVEVTGVSTCCEACAPVYSVMAAMIGLYSTRSLRRAWEAESFYGEAYGFTDVHILNHAAENLESNGMTGREETLLGSWDSWIDTDIGRRVAPPHLCLPRSTVLPEGI